MKNNKGEISIPTILIVIILIVLAGICIFMLTGENGVFVPKYYEQNKESNNSIITENTNQNNNTTDNEVLVVPVE